MPQINGRQVKDGSILPQDVAILASDAGGDDTYAATFSPAITSYVDGMLFLLRATTANTGACSFDAGPGAKSIKLNGSDPANGAVPASGIIILAYNATGDRFDLISGSGGVPSHTHPESDVTNLVTDLAAKQADAQPSVRAYHNANQSIATGTSTALALNSTRYDSDGAHNTDVNNSRLTCFSTTAGKHVIHGTVRFAVNTVGIRYVIIRLNGTTEIARHSQGANTGGAETTMSIATVYGLVATDYVELLVYHTAGESLNVEATSGSSPEFGMARIGS